MLTESDRSLLLTLAREQIQATLQTRSPNLPEAGPGVNALGGAFVTLHSSQGGSRMLRGCIGHIEAVDTLYNTVKQVSLSAAFNDHRFPPVAAEELEWIDIEISVLSPFVKIERPEDVTPGTHGLYMRSGHRSGLLLPQVATERNWDRETFLAQTCTKAGLPTDAWKQPGTEIYTFTAEVFGEQQGAAHPGNRRD